MEGEHGLSRKMEPRHCPTCETQFAPSRRWQKFCSETCRDGWHNEERRKALVVYRAQ